MVEPSDLILGTQIIYVPDHAGGSQDHPDCERGFVTSVRGGFAFCRYWRKDLRDLRTKKNSEATPFEYLHLRTSVHQSLVTAAIQQYVPVA